MMLVLEITARRHYLHMKRLAYEIKFAQLGPTFFCRYRVHFGGLEKMTKLQKVVIICFEEQQLVT